MASQRAEIAAHTANIRVDDLSQIIDICKETIGEFNSEQAFWRGHGNAEWLLIPHVFRTDPEHPEVPKYDECALIGNFQVRAPTRSHTKTPEPDDYFGWLFLAQHYGLPTRLLDWTENPLVALYFAVLEQEEASDGCIWALWPRQLNATFGASFGSIQNFRPPRSPNLSNLPLWLVSRMLLSHLGHRWARNRSENACTNWQVYPTQLSFAIEYLPYSSSWLRIYVVPGEHKRKIRAQLAAMGIKQSNLFPDSTNLAAELRGMRFV